MEWEIPNVLTYLHKTTDERYYALCHMVKQWLDRSTGIQTNYKTILRFVEKPNSPDMDRDILDLLYKIS